jgi:hypothetical protein
MKLQSKKARVPIVALGVAALVSSGGWLASSASAAPIALTLSSGATTPAVGNFGYASIAASNAAYALKVTGADGPVSLSLDSSPTAAAQLAWTRSASNGAAGITTAWNTASRPVSGTNETQSVTNSSSGTFTLSFMGQTTAAIATAADGDAIKAALEALSTIGVGNVSVPTGAAASSAVHVVTFTGGLAATDVALMTTTGTASAVAAGTPGVGPHGFVGIGTPTSSDNIYVTADVPGTYTFRLYQDVNQTGTYESADERAADLITLTVQDTANNTAGTADDVSPVIAATSPILQGLTFTPTVTYDKTMSMTDARGNTATGLAARLAALTYTNVNGGSDASGTGTLTGITDTAGTDTAAVYSTSTQKISFPAALTPTAVGYVALGADFTSALGSPAYSAGAKVVQVTSNSVTAITLAATDVAGKVLSTTSGGGATSVAVNKNTTAVTYKARITAPEPSGKTVYFTLSGTDAAAEKLTTNGTTVDAVAHVYSALSDGDGYASLTVTDTAATLASYAVQASSNLLFSESDTTGSCVANNTGGHCTPLPVTYTNNALAALAVTSTTAELTQPTTATSVEIKGKLTDTFGSAYVAGSADPATVIVTYGSTTTSAPLAADGTFKYTYTPATTPTAGTSTTVGFSYTASGGAAKTDSAIIQWSSTAVPASIALTAPTASAAKTLLTKATPVAAGQAVSGSVYDAANAALAYKSVTLSGDGVYFSTTASPTSASTGDNLTKTFTTVTGADGSFTAYAYFTKPGTITLTAMSGSAAKKTVDVVVSASIDPYKITLNDAKGRAGSNITVTGKVTDMFGNGVPSNEVDLSVGSAEKGTLNDSVVVTSADGSFSDTFVAASDADGEVVVTATLNDHANALMTSSLALIPATTWLDNAGLTFANGLYQTTSKITVAPDTLTLVATAKLVGGGKAEISGMYKAKSGVDIYAKASGADSFTLFDSVETDAEGEYGAAYTLKKTTSFLAKAGGLSSKVATTTVMSKVTLTGKSYSHNRATLWANGSPSAKGTLTFYRSVAGKDPILKSMTSNSFGNGKVTVTLPKGLRSVYVIFKAPGTGAGTSKTLKIQVK